MADMTDSLHENHKDSENKWFHDNLIARFRPSWIFNYYLKKKLKERREDPRELEKTP